MNDVDVSSEHIFLKQGAVLTAEVLLKKNIHSRHSEVAGGIGNSL